MIVITGGLSTLDGRIAVVHDERAVDESGLLIPRRLPVGTVHIDVGRVLLDSGAGVFSDSVPARRVTVLLAAVSSILTFSFTPAYPLWALVVVSIDVLVIWALTAHGKEMRRA